ncbi:glycosyltransferase family 2 protein [Nonlabens ulvanivorans]|uniref:Glycosyl transferase family 2 n=1 Tax=Nonlabens ulvanivorans TaxID=906888 RepID=A0ABX5E8Z8_NONUL|nr:glycosyltransferase family 2 protein [Nonlabens ulvanivorans]PRX14363.1 glycosyl transferase family 2 [Nonlabens ulvanivorans]
MISIIIPVFNRVDLVKDTLGSITQQSYQNWECVIVDDGSTDGSQNAIQNFIATDKRFQFIQRPQEVQKGAPSCRNMGLSHATGDYIQFFDSDDIMIPSMLEDKLALLESGDYDYVISKTHGFQHPNVSDIIVSYDKYYRFDSFGITNYNYVSQHINWLTPDFLGKSFLFENLRFNENLKSGQEFNLFSKLTLKTCKAVVLDKITTLRRMHDSSIRSKLNKDSKKLVKQKSELFKETYVELSESEVNQESLDSIILQMAENYLVNSHVTNEFSFMIAKLISIKGFLFAIQYCAYLFIFIKLNKGFSLKKNLLNGLVRDEL